MDLEDHDDNHSTVQRLEDRSSKSIQSASYAAQTHEYIVSIFVALVAVTTVDFLVLFLILFSGLLDVGLVALGESVFIVVAGVLDVLAVGAGDGVAVAGWLLVYDHRYCVF